MYIWRWFVTLPWWGIEVSDEAAKLHQLLEFSGLRFLNSKIWKKCDTWFWICVNHKHLFWALHTLDKLLKKEKFPSNFSSLPATFSSFWLVQLVISFSSFSFSPTIMRLKVVFECHNEFMGQNIDSIFILFQILVLDCSESNRQDLGG